MSVKNLKMEEKKPGEKVTLSTVGAAFVTYVVMVSKLNNLLLYLSLYRFLINW